MFTTNVNFKIILQKLKFLIITIIAVCKGYANVSVSASTNVCDKQLMDSFHTCCACKDHADTNVLTITKVCDKQLLAQHRRRKEVKGNYSKKSLL
jgi:uncharacterized protein YktB (UPF0637 family)